MKVAEAVGKANTTLLLSLAYIFLVGIAWIVVTIRRKNPMRTPNSDSGSFWKARATEHPTVETIRNQF
ncbi:MAG: hypothetical protein HY966_00115 [Ignavibacteriales bacterium]|nr:hypothetical protein [Ignavibacteriales bacterium]